jgi:hypothetical protein
MVVVRRCVGASRKRAVEKEHENGNDRIEEKSAPFCHCQVPALPGSKDCRQAACQRAKRAGQISTHVVAREQGRAVARGDRLGQDGLLGRQEHAHVAGRGIQSADNGQYHQRPEGRDTSKAESRDGHQTTRGK